MILYFFFFFFFPFVAPCTAVRIAMEARGRRKEESKRNKNSGNSCDVGEKRRSKREEIFRIVEMIGETRSFYCRSAFTRETRAHPHVRISYITYAWCLIYIYIKHERYILFDTRETHTIDDLPRAFFWREHAHTKNQTHV